jgi:glutamate-ammonia-ligase adenylyltransferase
MSEIEHVRKCSRYLDILLRNNPDYRQWLLSEGNLNRKYPLTGLYSDLGCEALKAQSFNDLLRIFRRFKQLHFLRIGSRDFLHYADLSETTGQLSDLASVALQVGLQVLSAHPDWWWAADEDQDVWRRLGGRIPLVALGLGKLGGHELNYVSDVDLIFLYTGEEEERQSVIVLLSRLTHRISRLLSDHFEGDRIFAVDFRLRPQGKQGLLVPSMSGALEHYLLRGQTWERQMLLKCRPVAGERSEGTAFIHELRPFVFRRFLDYQAIAELRQMRARILTEAMRFRPGARQFDVKLGIGGIREVEFIVQSLQLIYGGRHPELDEANTLKCLEKLSGLGLLPQATADELKDSYTFLRKVEHCIQLDQNRQTQSLPISKAETMRLVLAMGFGESEAAFLEALEMHCSIVHADFQDLFQEQSGPEGEQIDPACVPSSRPFPGKPLELVHARHREGLPAQHLKRLQETLRAYPAAVEREIFCGALEKFAEVCDRALLEKILIRLDTYFGRAARRPGLVKLFGTAGPWLAPFCRAIASSELLGALLSHNPALVEGLALRSGIFSTAPEWEASSIKIVERATEYGEKLEWIRRLKNERTLQLALAELGGLIDFSALEEEQTCLADFVIGNTLTAVSRNLGAPADLPLSVLGMGRLGSGEMSYLSDLDLVFVYSPKAHEPDDQIPSQVVRLIQRLMNMLSTPLQEGPGYPMDARLRPTGTRGPLVVTRKSWLDYYEAHADIWEIQALLRIRPVAGDPELGQWIDEKAAGICYRQRSPEAVWPRLCHLRERMEKERAAETGEEIDLKLGVGGLADIEFVIQGQALAGGSMPPSRIRPFDLRTKPPEKVPHLKTTGMYRSLGRLVQECLKDFPETGHRPDEFSADLRALRALDHRVRLHTNSSAAKIDARRFESMVLLGLWPPLRDGSSVETWQDVLRLRREVRGLFRRFCP